MAGASYSHNLVVANVIRELGTQLRPSDCAVLPSDLRVWIEASRRYVYPDVTVVCGDPELTGADPEALVNPTLLVEVLSDVTKDCDRGEKFELYRTLPSLAEYVLLAQDRVHCEHHVRQPEGGWLLTEERSHEGVVTLAAIDCRLPLAEVYERVPFAGPRRV